MRYNIYFRFCGLRHICTQWSEYAKELCLFRPISQQLFVACVTATRKALSRDDVVRLEIEICI